MEKSLTLYHSIAKAVGDEWGSAIQTIQANMPEIHRGVSNIKKRNSQTMMSLMTLNMLDTGPYRVVSQILVQLDTKFEALIISANRLRRKKAQLKNLHTQTDKVGDELHFSRIEKLEIEIQLAKAPIENLIREIGALQQRYKEVIKNKNIPVNWTEEDFEKAEIEHHIKTIFKNAIKDRLSGQHNMGTMEYMEQFGIEPIAAYSLVDNFIRERFTNVAASLKKQETPTMKDRYEFYDAMYDFFKDSYKEAQDRLGLDSIMYNAWLRKDEA